MPRKKESVEIEDSNYIVHSKEKALKKSIVEGSFCSAYQGMSHSYITPFALALGSSSLQVGFLSSFAGLFSPIGQLFGSKLMEKYSRKSIILRMSTIQILLWIPIISLIWLHSNNLFLNYLPLLLIVFYSMLFFAFGLKNPSFFSWMGDLVDPKKRGKYFSKRNKINQSVGLVSFLLGAFVLDYFKTKGFVLIGFAIIFSLAIFFKFISKEIMKGIFSPKLKLNKGYYFSFKDFIKRYDNFGKFSFYQAFLFFSLMISSPFFAVYMLKYLNFNYVTFTVISLSPVIFFILFSPIVGKFSDKFGNVKLLYLAGFLFPIVPLLWIFIESPLYLILFPSLISGLANAAFILAINDFTYDAVSVQRRGLCVAYTSLLTGIGIFLGSIIGGLIIEYLPINFMKPILFSFLVSSLLILMVSLFFLPQLKEVRKTEEVPLSADLSHPFKTIHSDVVWFKNFLHDGKKSKV